MTEVEGEKKITVPLLGTERSWCKAAKVVLWA